MNNIVRIGITALTSFVITSGTAIMTAGNQQPSNWGLIVMCVGGVVAAAHTVQQLMSEPPK